MHDGAIRLDDRWLDKRELPRTEPKTDLRVF